MLQSTLDLTDALTPRCRPQPAAQSADGVSQRVNATAGGSEAKRGVEEHSEEATETPNPYALT